MRISSQKSTQSVSDTEVVRYRVMRLNSSITSSQIYRDVYNAGPQTWLLPGLCGTITNHS